ncbi:MAG: glycosyltransferase family 2 protein [Limnochordales bacterium]|nr:glycosyltransferase family 2 protein [Limnochordales bacterium]
MDREREVFLSVVIPAYNESRRLGPSLESIAAYIEQQPFPCEVIVVSDGSTDDTVKIARSFEGRISGLKIIDRKVNRGKGYSVAEGMRLARGEYVLFTDADLSTPITEVDKLLQYLRSGCDIAIGSRYVPYSEIKVPQPWSRRLMGRTFRGLVGLLALREIKDPQCGFKCFTREAAKEVFTRLTVAGFAFDIEALTIAEKLGYRIAEVPVSWAYSPESTVNVWADPPRMFADLIRIRWRHCRLSTGAARPETALAENHR